MECPRCQGFMVHDTLTDFSMVIAVERCVNCGHRDDRQSIHMDHLVKKWNGRGVGVYQRAYPIAT